MKKKQVFNQIDLKKNGRITLEDFMKSFNEFLTGTDSDTNINSDREYEEDLYSNETDEDGDDEDFNQMIQSLNAEKIINK